MESALHKTKLSDLPDDFAVIETLGFTPADGFARLGLHMDRAEATCARLGIAFDRGAALGAVGGAVGSVAARVRMAVDKNGRLDVAVAAMPAAASAWRVRVATHVLDADDPWLAVKTTQRAVYDRDRAALPDGVDEMIYLNAAGVVCEGTITNVFVERGGVLVTPPVSSGLLPGVLRAELLAQGRAVEDDLTLGDLAGGFHLGNSLRGLMRAELV